MKNESADATTEYLKSLGLDPQKMPTPAVVTMAHRGQDPFAWQGETYERLRHKYDFYRATQAHDGVSIKLATAEGYVAIPGEHDAQMAGCTSDKEVIMIRDKEVSQQVRAAEQARRDRLNETTAEGIQLNGIRRSVDVQIHV